MLKKSSQNRPSTGATLKAFNGISETVKAAVYDDDIAISRSQLQEELRKIRELANETA